MGIGRGVSCSETPSGIRRPRLGHSTPVASSRFGWATIGWPGSPRTVPQRIKGNHLLIAQPERSTGAGRHAAPSQCAIKRPHRAVAVVKGGGNNKAQPPNQHHHLADDERNRDALTHLRRNR